MPKDSTKSTRVSTISLSNMLDGMFHIRYRVGGVVDTSMAFHVEYPTRTPNRLATSSCWACCFPIFTTHICAPGSLELHRVGQTCEARWLLLSPFYGAAGDELAALSDAMSALTWLIASVWSAYMHGITGISLCFQPLGRYLVFCIFAPIPMFNLIPISLSTDEFAVSGSQG
jgi:hypothetical protein